MTEAIIFVIYVSFLLDFLVFPIPSPASTRSLLAESGHTTRFNRLWPLAHALVLCAWLLPAWMHFVSPDIPDQMYGVWLGITVAIIGRAVTLTASHTLRHAESTIITTGVFKFSRHPIVLGMHLTLAGLLLPVTGVWGLLLLGAVLIYFDGKIRIEEKELLQNPLYSTYAKKTRRYFGTT